MIVTMTAKLKIKPTADQSHALQETINTYHQGCKLVSVVVFDTRKLMQSAINKKTYHTLRGEIGLRSQMAQSVIRTVIAKYRALRTNDHDWVYVRFRKQEYDLVWNRDYSLISNRFSVNTLLGRIKVPFESKGMEKYLDGTWHFGTAKLMHKHRKWFLHIPMSKEIASPQIEELTQVVGIDLGINFIAAAYDSQGKTIFFPGRAMKRKRANYKRVRQELQHKRTCSSRRKLKQIGQRENRWMTDVNHQVSKALVSRYGANTLFVLEDLTGVRSTTEKARMQNRYLTVSWSFHQLRKMIEYKAGLSGSMSIAVDPKYTSQTCPKPDCGHIAKANRDKRKHLFRCQKCGYQSNDDRIGAMNLALRGKLYLLQSASAARLRVQGSCQSAHR